MANLYESDLVTILSLSLPSNLFCSFFGLLDYRHTLSWSGDLHPSISTASSKDGPCHHTQRECSLIQKCAFMETKLGRPFIYGPIYISFSLLLSSTAILYLIIWFPFLYRDGWSGLWRRKHIPSCMSEILNYFVILFHGERVWIHFGETRRVFNGCMYPCPFPTFVAVYFSEKRRTATFSPCLFLHGVDLFPFLAFFVIIFDTVWWSEKNGTSGGWGEENGQQNFSLLCPWDFTRLHHLFSVPIRKFPIFIVCWNCFKLRVSSPW